MIEILFNAKKLNMIKHNMNHNKGMLNFIFTILFIKIKNKIIKKKNKKNLNIKIQIVIIF